MDNKTIKFDDTEIEEYKFKQHKFPISINNIDINKIVISNKLPFDKKNFKYFLKVRPWYIFRPNMSIYKRNFHKTRYMYFSIKIL